MKSKLLTKVLPYWPVYAIFAVWVIFSSPFLFKGLVPFPSKYLVTFFPPWAAEYSGPVKNAAMPDVITQIYPWKKLTIETWKAGQVPLWNPYSFSGTVHAGNYQSAVFSPVNLLFFIMPFDTAWSWMILLQPLLAGLFMFLYLTELRLGKAARFLGSLAFMFCGFGVVWMAYGTLFYAALNLPLALAMVEREIRKPRAFNGIILAAAILFSFLSGHFQISLYVLAMTVSYIWWTSWENKHLFLRLMGYAAAGLGMAAPQLLLTFDAYRESVRSGSFVKGEIIPWQYLITLIFPDFYGNPVTRNDWFGHYAEWASYIGIVPLAFAARTFFSRLNHRRRFFLASAVISLLFAYQGPFSELLYALRIPALSTSAASRVIILFSFSMAVLSAYGLDLQVRDWETGNMKNPKRIFLLFAVFATGITLAIYLARPFAAEQLAVAKRNVLLPSFLLLGTGILVFTGYANKGNRIFMTLAIGLLAATASFDSLRFATKWMPFDPPQFMYPETGAIRYMTRNAGSWRIFGNIGGEVCVTFALLCVDGYDAMYQSRYGSFIASADDGIMKTPSRSVVQLAKRAKGTDRMLDRLGVKYIVHRRSDTGSPFAYPVWDYGASELEKVYGDRFYEVYERKTVKPRVSAAGTANITKYTPQEIDLQVSSRGTQPVLLSDVHSGGWKAYVGGTPVPVRREQTVFRAVDVPAGRHEVTFRYWPDSFTAGIILAAGSIMFLIFLSARRRNV